MKKKTVSILLVLMVAISLFSGLSASAGTSGAVWDGTAKTEPSQSGGVYQIGTGEEMAWFTDYVNTGHGSANAKLTADIYLNDDTGYALWTDSSTGLNACSSIGKYYSSLGSSLTQTEYNSYKTQFGTLYTYAGYSYSESTSYNAGTEYYYYVCYSGTFDGDGHYIRGLYINAPSAAGGIGLFGAAGNGAKIKNVAVTGYINSTSSIGGIIGIVIDGAAAASGCLSMVNLNKSGNQSSYNAGGVIGEVRSYGANSGSATVTDCIYGGTITGSFSIDYTALGWGITYSEDAGIIGYGDASSIQCYNCHYLENSSYNGLTFGKPVTAAGVSHYKHGWEGSGSYTKTAADNNDGTVSISCSCGYDYIIDGLPFLVTAGASKITSGDNANVAVDNDGYSYYDYASSATKNTTLYTVTIPAGITSVELCFDDNVLAYNYDASGSWLAGDYPDYHAGESAALRNVDANGDGNIDFIQVQSPYDNSGMYGASYILYAVTFKYQDACITGSGSISNHVLTADYAVYLNTANMTSGTYWLKYQAYNAAGEPLYFSTAAYDLNDIPTSGRIEMSGASRIEISVVRASDGIAVASKTVSAS